MVRELLGGVAVDPSAAKVCLMSVFHSIITSALALAVRASRIIEERSFFMVVILHSMS
jgi:hypothetical protein